MRSLVVYESMYGNTHLVAEAIGRGLVGSGPVDIVPVGQATSELLVRADLVVVGGPTHAHGMTRPSTRKGAAEDVEKTDNKLTLDPDAEGEGLREWFDDLETVHAAAAAFDTRLKMPAVVTGRASKGINKRLKKHGFDVVTEPESFLVELDSTALESGEESRAEAWGATLAQHVVTTSA